MCAQKETERDERERPREIGNEREGDGEIENGTGEWEDSVTGKERAKVAF